MNAQDFVLDALPSVPARVLEVGCGKGELARALAEAGYDVLAIDPDPPEGPLFRRTRIEDLVSTEVFDAVVAQLSLHHVTDLAVALDNVVDVLSAEGRVVIDDFGWELLDRRAADRLGIPFEEWQEEHEHLHGSDAMIIELDVRFTRRSFSWEPFLFRESRGAIEEEAERRLIEERQLPAIGFRYVGER